ncbi:MAG: Arylsulfatase precursor [Planctomycetota bacterium]
MCTDFRFDLSTDLKSHRFLFLWVFGFVSCCLFGLSPVAAADSDLPNVIVIFTDDHGWADLGAQAVRDDIRTPHLDALAKGGVRAESGYVTAPQCVPSRAGLLSGRYQNRFGVEHNGLSVEPFQAERNIAERLKQAGYATGMAGKWHLGDHEKIGDHGFDQYFFKHSNAPGFWNMDMQGRDIEPSQHRGGYHLELIADFACAFIRRNASRPFFFYLAPRAPHTPLDAPQKYTSRFPGKMPERRRQALAMISAMDDGVGRIMQTLRELELEERTLIFVMGDNGAPLKIHQLDSPLNLDAGGWDGSINLPMNGEKGTLCEGGIRTPWLAYWKGRIPAGQVYRHPVISLDVASTAAAVAGLKIPDDAFDGVNLMPYFTGEKLSAPHERLFWRWTSQSAVREGGWKLIRGGDEREYLYDLDADPGEKTDLLAQHPEIAGRLRQQLRAWAGSLTPPGVDGMALTPVARGYFDYYLDGKPAPRPEQSVPEKKRRSERKKAAQKKK